MTLFTQILLQTATTPASVDNDFAPMLFGMVLLMGVTVLVLIGIGIAIGCFLIVSSLVGLAVGVVSASVLIGYLNKSFLTGVKSFVLLVAGIVGVPVGIVCIHTVV